MFSKKQKAAAFHPGKQFDWKTNGNLEGFFSDVDLSVCFSLRCHPNPLGEFLWLKICGRGAVSRTKHSCQTIWTSHCLPQKRKQNAQKNFASRKARRMAEAPLFVSYLSFFCVFIIFLHIIIIIILIIVLSPFTWFAGDSALVFINLDCWDHRFAPPNQMSRRGQPRREFVKPIIHSLYLPGQGALRLVGVEKNCVLFMCVFRGILISKFLK